MPFNLKKDGSYEVFDRAYCPSANDFSFWLKVDDGEIEDKVSMGERPWMPVIDQIIRNLLWCLSHGNPEVAIPGAIFSRNESRCLAAGGGDFRDGLPRCVGEV